ncbi:MAG: SLBB domain-containing protein [Bacteroidota bacterium]
MKKNLLLFISLLILQFCLSLHALGQEEDDKEKIIQQAQQDISIKLSPEQVRAKLKELGMTEEDAIRRARERNIDLEQFLQQAQGGKIKTTKTAPENPNTPATVTQETAPLSTMAVEKDSIPPEFKNRKSIGDLKAFGYDIFQYSVTTFEPNVNISIPPGYTLGSGDEILLNVWGDTQLSYQLAVNRDGSLLIPNVGQIPVNGLSVERLKSKLLERMSQVYASLRRGQPNATSFLDVSLGKVRTIQVFVLGQVKKPGAYSLSGLSTAFTALYYAGGPAVTGSLREISVRRGATNAGTIDFYDFAIDGDKSKDIRLQDGDVVFVRFAGRRVALEGKVRRPAIYELKSKESLSTLLRFGGGLAYDADFRRIHIERIVPFESRDQYQRSLLDLDVQFTAVEQLTNSPTELSDGDIVHIRPIRQDYENRITISGNVQKPGVYELKKGMHIHDLILAADSLLEDTFLDRGNILRVLPDLRKQIIPFNVQKAIDGNEEDNIALERLDSVYIYKTTYFHPERKVSVSGSVRTPGIFPRTEKLMLSSVIISAGGVTEEAELSRINVSRRDTTSEQNYSLVFDRTMPSQYWNTPFQEDFELADEDHIEVLANPRMTKMRFCSIQGEIRYPGTYAIEYEGQHLMEIIRKAGGFKNTAYLAGAKFIRRSGKEKIQVPIDLNKIMEDTTILDNLVLLNGDSLDVPSNQNVVIISGEVYFPSAALYKKGASLSYYLHQAGDVTQYAEESETIVTLPGGKKWEKGWFLPHPEILAGSSIYVPKKKEDKGENLQIIRDWAIIIANTAVIAIAVVQLKK